MGGGDDSQYQPYWYEKDANGKSVTVSPVDEDGNPVHPLIHNPGTVDLAGANPELWQQIQNLRDLRKRYMDSMAPYLDPARYDMMRTEMLDRADTEMTNRFARSGLAGSSAAFGAGAEAGRRLDMMMMDRRMRDIGLATQGEMGLDAAITADILRGQAGYAGYQQLLANLKNQEDQNNSNLWGDIVKGVATVGGAVAGGVLGGPPGAIAGAGVGSRLDTGPNLGVDGGLGNGNYSFGTNYGSLYSW